MARRRLLDLADRRAVDVYRLGGLHVRRRRGAGSALGPIPRAAPRRDGDRGPRLSVRQRRIPVRAADAGDGEVDARGRDGRRATIGSRGALLVARARDGLDVRVAQRLDPDEPTRVFRDGRRRPVLPLGRGRASALPARHTSRSSSTCSSDSPASPRALRAARRDLRAGKLAVLRARRWARSSSCRADDRSSRTVPRRGAIQCSLCLPVGLRRDARERNAARPFETAFSFGIVLLGFPVFYGWRALRNRRASPPAWRPTPTER